MLFAPDSVALILSGAKTQTRRPVTNRDMLQTVAAAGEYAPWWSPSFTGPIDEPIEAVKVSPEPDLRKPSRLKWLVGRTYAVCPGRGKPAVCRIRITEIRCQRVADISADDARAEGLRGIDARSEYGWSVMYGERALGSFGNLAEGGALQAAYLALWRSLYPKSDCTELCWALTFKVVP